MKIFVTGALGVIARHLLPELMKSREMVLTDIKEGEIAGHQVTACDLLDFENLVRRMEGCDAVLHLAIASGRDFPDRSCGEYAISSFDSATITINTQGTHHLLEAALRNGARRVVNLSSLTVLGGYPGALERSQPNLVPKPAKLYAATKQFGEELGELYFRQHDLEVLTLRIGQPYPIGTQHDKDCFLTPESRQFSLHVEDLVAGVKCAFSTNVRHGVFNLASFADPYSVDLKPAASIGYYPSKRFRENGVETL